MLNFCIQLKGGYFCETYEVTVKNMKNKVAYYKEITECWHAIFWPGRQRRPLFLNTKPE